MPKTASEIEGLTSLLADCYDDPDLFNTAILQREPYWTNPGSGHPDQLEWVQACAESPVVCVETANSQGKDYALGGLIPWWCFSREDALAIVTGPSQTLLGSVTWKELRRAMDPGRASRDGRDSLLKLFPEVFEVELTAGVKASPLTMPLAPGWGALAYSTTSIERASGQHAENLAVFVTEASGITDEIGEALDSLKATLMVLCGNPIRPDGWFVDYCLQGEADARNGVPKEHAVRYFNMPVAGNPHSKLEKSPFGMSDRTWIEAMRRRYGDGMWCRIHLDAIRPRLSHEVLIKPEWLDLAISDRAERAANDLRRKGQAGKKRLSCDPGGGTGNARTVVIVRDDVGILELSASQFANESGAAAEMARLAEKHGVADGQMSYDGGGQVGKKVGLALSGLGHPNVRPYFGGGRCGVQYANMRTGAACAFARRLDPDAYAPPGQAWRPFHIPNCPELPAVLEELRELRACEEVDKTALEKKDDFMLRLGRSPDFADAITQGFHEEAARR